MTQRVRNADLLRSVLVEQGDQILTKQTCTIEIPCRFASRGLAQIGIDNYILAFFPFILEDGTYAVMQSCSICNINPYRTRIVKIDDVEYYEFSFRAGDVVIKNINVVRKEAILFPMLDEMFFKGKTPWYASYDDVGKMFDTANTMAGSNIGTILEVNELLASLICRDKDDRNKYIREVYEDGKIVESSDMYVVPLQSVHLSAVGTFNKMTGAYFIDGIISGLVNDSDQVDNLEAVYRA